MTAVTAILSNAELLEGLKAPLSDSRILINALIQGAIRAGAKQAWITLTPTEITVESDGPGIADFSTLLKPGHTESQIAEHLHSNPYGMGLLLGLHHSSRVDVVSGGRRLLADSESMLNGDMVITTPEPDTGKTKITLQGRFAWINHRTVQLYLIGCPIPVRLNGEKLLRPCQVHPDAQIISDAAGKPKARIYIESQPAPTMLGEHIVFLDGELVDVTINAGETVSEVCRHLKRGAAVIHLESSAFQLAQPQGDRVRGLTTAALKQRVASWVRLEVRRQLREAIAADTNRDEDALAAHFAFTAKWEEAAIANLQASNAKMSKAAADQFVTRTVPPSCIDIEPTTSATTSSRPSTIAAAAKPAKPAFSARIYMERRRAQLAGQQAAV